MFMSKKKGAGALIDLSDRNNLGGSGGGGGFQYPPQPAGFIGYPPAPALPQMPMPPAGAPFSYPSGPSSSCPIGNEVVQPSAPPSFNYNILPNVGETTSTTPAAGGCGGSQEKKDLNINTTFLQVICFFIGVLV